MLSAVFLVQTRSTAMVLFENININQRVEVLFDGKILTGTVRYKGSINGIRGEWVGVELDEPLLEGSNEGRVNGRRYFSCRPQRGMFTTASQIRFIPLKRFLRDPYHKVSEFSEIDPDLFESGVQREQSTTQRSRTESWVDTRYLKRATSAKFDHYSNFYPERRYPLRHTVGNSIPSAIMQRPELEKSSCIGNRTRSAAPATRLSCQGYSVDSNRSLIQQDPADFINPPSIPKPHMPHSALKRYVRGGCGLHWPREMTVNTGRDAVKLAQWNDISA